MNEIAPVGLNLGPIHGGSGDPATELRELAQRAEAAGYTFLVVEDGYGGADERTGLDPIAVASFLGNTATHLGVIAGVRALYAEAFDVAEAVATLDFDLHGRAGWMVHRDTSPGHAGSFDRDITQRPSDIDCEIDEFIDVVGRLFDGWEDGAVIRDATVGAYLDVSKIHRINHQGPYLRVRGPLVTPRPPQGRVPSFVRGVPDDLKESVVDFVIVAAQQIRDRSRIDGATGLVVEVPVDETASITEAIADWSHTENVAAVILAPRSAAALDDALQPGLLVPPTGDWTLRDVLGLQRPPNIYAVTPEGVSS